MRVRFDVPLRLQTMRRRFWTSQVAVAPSAWTQLQEPVAPKRELLLEDAYRPGKRVSFERFKGDTVVLRGVAPE